MTRTPHWHRRSAEGGSRVWRAGPLGCVAVAVAFAAWAPPSGNSPPTPPGDEPSRAEVTEVYARDCAVCHGSNAAGTDRGPDLAGSGLALVDYMIRTGRMPIAEPGDEIRRSPPAYDPPMIDALVAYVGGLQDGAVADGPPIPEVDPDAGNIAQGGEIWRLNCAACHQWSGHGGALLDRSAPDVTEASALEMAEAVRAGPLAMPGFGTAAIDDDELDSLAAYLERELKSPSDPGGWPIRHLGPVAEGAVALVAGVGLLAVVTRLLGTGREPQERET